MRLGLLKSDLEIGALLLEHIRPGSPLKSLSNDSEATAIAASVMKSILRPTQDATLFASVHDWFSSFADLRQRFSGKTGPFDESLIDLAEQLGTDLLDSMGEQVVLHGDLHHDNIVHCETSGWLAIDPKGVIGEREYEAGSLLRNPDIASVAAHFDKRLDIIAAETGFDRKRMLHWAIMQMVLSAVWSVDGKEETWRPMMEQVESLRSKI